MSRPLCGTAAILNRPSCHNLLCTILDLADTRNPELYCVAVTVRPDNPSLLAKTAPAADSEWCLSRNPRWTDGSASPAGCIFVLESSSAYDTPLSLIAAQSKRVRT